VANPYYQPDQTRGQRVEDLFKSIAPRYDLINDLQSFGLHRIWKRRLAQLANLRPGMRALDVCCGTGDIAFALTRGGAKVVGVDFSQAMLEVAEARIGSLAKVNGHAPVGASEAARAPLFIRGDGQHLPFGDNTFDGVTVGYGLRNLANWQHGLKEMSRVAKPGAPLLVLDFGKPANRVWRGLYFRYLGWCVPIFGRLFCKNAPAYAYILESLRYYPAQQGVAEHMRNLGCRDVRVINLIGGAMSINAAVK
jgi:demethylmenaquinone methyltransferase / 2-methoxy-6-polyprenyl-1,4-benzoquinol methylase